MSLILKENKDVLIGQRVKPDWRTSKMGYKFDLNDDVWQIDGSTKLNLGRMRDIDETTAHGLRKALGRYAEELSSSTVDNVFTCFNTYCDCTNEPNVSVSGLSRWRSSLTDETEYRLGTLKGFLIAWNEWGFSGVDDKVVDFLEELKLRGNQKGKAVSNSCPYSGPLTRIELGALLDWVSNAFINKVIDLTQYAFFVALVFTGRRPVQIRALRGCDLACKEDANGYDYILTCPRAKQRGTGFRKVFRSMAINEDLYLLLDNQAEASQAYVERVLGRSLPQELRKQIPVFLARDRVAEMRDIEHLVTCLNEMPDYLHMTEKDALCTLSVVSVKNTARSERTGEFISFTARRFRYTKGTNLARKGITGVALAYAFDHSDTQQIDVYTENTEEMADQIDAIMGPILAPLALAFAGKLINSERDALRANDPHSRVRNDGSSVIGNCGTHAFCLSGYRSCYTCINFQAWRDAPHEEVRDEILNERQRQKNLGISPNVISATDRLLLAVEQVIIMCKQAKFEDSREVIHG
jgi:hypothetical protein